MYGIIFAMLLGTIITASERDGVYGGRGGAISLISIHDIPLQALIPPNSIGISASENHSLHNALGYLVM